ncbi:hypothetical protein TPHA_0D02950 [Tetrapisispora phaffii CBS 4417]|uniref:TLC domain-containing protein n=1 Tax=Tetrapisispora phaffii (strain ATCC 24235 / CBS 4417 / NBRC 1672 / NRRL Y-8282 / UCD 70-5) TaxID=1071381 RepID=G8BSW0_TETPH|nr:hypothetical protein TPHA_0D02950 [Tetrapisispora phaffii CBS 4417]CCE62931.1 hypothetical protein TPHA_0D02950 [Tetrapisispora phaffii CBS 4417]
MDFVVNGVVELPQPGFFNETIIPFLMENNVIQSERIAANLHSIFYISIFYHLWFLFGTQIMFPKIANLLFDKKDETLTDKKKYNALMIQSGIHLVSFVQAIIVLYLSLKCMLYDEEYYQVYTDSFSRIFGSIRATEVICVYAIGYFVWDIYISSRYSELPFILHGIISTVVYVIGLKPSIQYYAPVFLMFELSNPSLNIRWFLMKYFPNQKSLLTANNLMLMVIFFFCRIAWGWLQIGKLCYDYYMTMDQPGVNQLDTIIIVGGNLVLDVLNIVWFRSMLLAAIKVLKQKFVNKKENSKRD